MNCDETLVLLDPLVDGELSDPEQRAVRLHLDGCPSCRREVDEINQLRQTLQGAPRHAVPDSLPTEIRNRLAEADGSTPHPARGRWITPVVSHAAAVLIGAVLVYGVVRPPGAPETPTREIVAAHVRALMDDRLIQVRSSNTHTVAPWFAGKIDYAPTVIDLSAEGFPLVGGRVDYIRQRKVAARVYQRRKHRINLFILVNNGERPATFVERSEKGYHVVGWGDASFTYWAISDLNSKELKAFARLLAAK